LQAGEKRSPNNKRKEEIRKHKLGKLEIRRRNKIPCLMIDGLRKLMMPEGEGENLRLG